MKTKNTLLKKVIILFIIVLIPLISVSIVFLHRNNVRQKEEVLSSIESNTANYISQFDESLRQIYSSNIHILEQNLISDLNNSYPFLSVYERSVQLNLIRDQLYGICSISPFLSSAHVHFYNHEHIFSSANYKYGSFQILNKKDIAFYQTLSANTGLLQYYLDPITKQKELSIFMVPSFWKPSYAINMILSQKELKKYMESNISYDQELYLFHLQNGFQLTNVPDAMSEDSLKVLSDYKNIDGSGYKEVQLNGEAYIAFFTHADYSGGTYLRFIPMESLVSSIHYSYWMIITFFLLVMFTCILFFIGIYRMVHKPLRALTAAFDEVEKGNFQIQVEPTGDDDFAYLYQAFNDMSTQLGRLIERDYNQKLLLQKAEMKQLQAQINPHFLYNSFFMLQRMIRFDPDTAQEVAAALASFFRYVTRNSMDQVTLKEEYEHVRNYTYIQGLRFESRILIELAELPDEFSHIPVPKLILQPILENIFKYGLHNKITDGLIRVTFLNDGNLLTVRVEDNGDELADETLLNLQQKLEASAYSSDKIEMSGILNIQRRLHIFSNYKDSLHVSRSELGGLCVEITLQTEEVPYESVNRR